jgi:ATP-dependent helicase/nuclease subunit A
VAEQPSLFDVLEPPPEPAPPQPTPPDQVDRHRIRTDIGRTLFVEAGAGAGKTTALVGRILSLVDDGVPIDAIAAITFTEKAAAELRHRIRERLAEAPVSECRQAALDGLDHAPIGTLHAFARRLLFEFPVEAGLPPGFTVLDELESQLALDERWEDLLDALLDDPGRVVAPGLRAAELVQLLEWGAFRVTRGLRRVVEDFQASWDLVEHRVDLTAPDRPVPRVDIVGRARALGASWTPADDTQAGHVARVAALAADLADAGEIGARLRTLDALRAETSRATGRGSKTKWRGREHDLDALRAEHDALTGLVDAELACWRRYRELVVGAICGRFVLDGAEARAAAGGLEFHDLLVLARRLLATHEGARHRLHERYQRLLLDEFQDTDPIQLEIAVRLTADPAGQPPDDASGLVPLPGRLFVVGDPKQSIYRFRRADIATYLAAADRIGADRAVLSANFRSTDAVIAWANGVFGEMIRAEGLVQPAYGPLDAARPGRREHGTVHVLGVDEHDSDEADAEELRRREAASVAAAIATALRERWEVGDGERGLRPCRPGDIAVLLPARTSLPMLEPALAELEIPYRAENAAVVYLAPEIRDVLLALRAAADPTDELALVASLRSPLYGCSDVELLAWRRAGGRFRMFRAPPEGMIGHPVAAGIAHLAAIARDVGRVAPAELLDRVVVERRVLETALGGPDARDVWRRVRFVVDQARAWTDAGGRGLRRYLRWAEYQAKEGRASDTILPERDHDAVRIMTIHAAKGLEFPITVVSGMTTEVRRPRGVSVVWLPGGWTLSEAGNELFEEFLPIDEQMSDAERRRLLYVACTRAVDHLVVSVHRKPRDPEKGLAKAPSANVLWACGAAGHGAHTLDVAAGPVGRPVEEALELPWPDAAAWGAERQRAMTAGRIRSATSATGLAVALSAPGDDDVGPGHDDVGPGDDHVGPGDHEALESDGGPAAGERSDGDTADPGLAKGGVDLDQPPWQRGRYGTAVGRAVHAVLQDADLATGADIELLAAAQCAAEGIFGLEARVVELCRSALTAPIVVAAAGGAEHWRELFVVAELGEQVLEGYIDLLVRTPDGLVIVDYKTDQWRPGADQAARLARYRHQLAAYGFALGRLLDEPIVGGVLVRCRPDGPADQLTIEDWQAAIAEVAATADAAVAVPSIPHLGANRLKPRTGRGSSRI